MTDTERASVTNGIWLCCECAKVIDADAAQFPVGLLEDWRKTHEAWVEAGRPSAPPAAREILVNDGGIGSIITNEGSGTAVEVDAAQGQTAERIHVTGSGIGEIITNTGIGTAKIVRSTGSPASEYKVTVDRPTVMAAGVMAVASGLKCNHCGHQFTASKVVEGFAGEQEPRVQVKCPNCSGINWI